MRKIIFFLFCISFYLPNLVAGDEVLLKGTIEKVVDSDNETVAVIAQNHQDDNSFFVLPLSLKWAKAYGDEKQLSFTFFHKNEFEPEKEIILNLVGALSITLSQDTLETVRSYISNKYSIDPNIVAFPNVEVRLLYVSEKEGEQSKDIVEMFRGNIFLGNTYPVNISLEFDNIEQVLGYIKENDYNLNIYGLAKLQGRIRTTSERVLPAVTGLENFLNDGMLPNTRLIDDADKSDGEYFSSIVESMNTIVNKAFNTPPSFTSDNLGWDPTTFQQAGVANVSKKVIKDINYNDTVYFKLPIADICKNYELIVNLSNLADPLCDE